MQAMDGRRRSPSPDGYKRQAGRRASPSYARRLTPERAVEPHPAYRSTQQGTRADLLEQRRQQRLNSTLTIWPPSPTHEHANDFPKIESKKSKHRSSRRRRYSDAGSGTDSGDVERRKRRKHKSSKEKKSKTRKHSRSPAPSLKSKRRDEYHDDGDEEQWVVKEADPPLVSNSQSRIVIKDVSDDSDDGIGPMPAVEAPTKAANPKIYGEALRPGEGSAMAAFVSEGQRIPRRGEIGLESTQIEAFEKAGYVMSGSRHRKMNAVRIRKENQVITAEEKRSLMKMQQEEKSKREQAIVSSFRELINDKLQTSGAERPA